ncbi:cytochrome b-c1 complex subunit 1, mitochondrial-like [Aricia agestis]|uniref:cytochrome b-c1 complex subunit 1, mitochondrial-like n=1 Tax=Aricia agestis TaxID=91739 RepID=UPI001C201A3F|nr:cytochrome b-c1 complex subunit 1, mitochondrial-like [Aricia agestis]
MFKRFCKPRILLLEQCRNFWGGRKEPKAPQIQLLELPNGVRVALEESCSPVVCASLYALAGSRFEDECNNGVSYFIEHMAYKGFSDADEDSIIGFLNSIGAKMTAHTTREYQSFAGVALAEYAPEIICLLSRIVKDLQFPSKESSVEKVKIRKELIENDSNQRQLVFDYLHQTAFQGTSLAYPVTPSSRNLKSFDSKTAATFMKRNFTPKRVVLAVSGGICYDQIRQIAEKSFDFSDCSDVCVLPNACKRYTGSQIIYRDDTMPLLHAAIAVEAPGYTSDDYLPMLVASCLTDSWDKTQSADIRHGSPLARAAATTQICERFESFYTAYSDVGLWGVYFVCKMQDADDMVFNIQDCWMNLCTTTTKKELERAVNTAKLKLAKNVNGVVNSCHDIGRQIILTSRRTPLEMYHHELDSLSAGKLKKVGYKYIYDKCPVVAAVGPSEVLPDYLRIRSGMYWLRF